MDSRKNVSGNKNLQHQQCRHSSLMKEFAYGGPTGNYICNHCQRLLSPSVLKLEH